MNNSPVKSELYVALEMVELTQFLPFTFFYKDKFPPDNKNLCLLALKERLRAYLYTSPLFTSSCNTLLCIPKELSCAKVITTFEQDFLLFLNSSCNNFSDNHTLDYVELMHDYHLCILVLCNLLSSIELICAFI